jgi:ribosomal protein S18 acetylase RimI-like enzyme
MPEIQIRPVVASDIPALVGLDHHFSSNHIWQLELEVGRGEDPAAEPIRAVNFRQVRLPRYVRVEYPRPAKNLLEDWSYRSGILVALLKGEPVGYLSLMLDFAPLTTWVTDLVVHRPLRRQGIGSALVLAAMEWGGNMDTHNLILEMQPKNYPALCLALKLGFELCGYNDRYYPNQEIGLFFGKVIR